MQHADENGVDPPAEQLYLRTCADLAVLRYCVHHDAMELTMQEDGLRRFAVKSIVENNTMQSPFLHGSLDVDGPRRYSKRDKLMSAKCEQLTLRINIGLAYEQSVLGEGDVIDLSDG